MLLVELQTNCRFSVRRYPLKDTMDDLFWIAVPWKPCVCTVSRTTDFAADKEDATELAPASGTLEVAGQGTISVYPNEEPMVVPRHHRFCQAGPSRRRH